MNKPEEKSFSTRLPKDIKAIRTVSISVLEMIPEATQKCLNANDFPNFVRVLEGLHYQVEGQTAVISGA